jgi:hypothetical protein
LSMFMLSFIFVKACGHFKWKRICAGFSYRLFIYVSNYQEGRVENTLADLTPPHFCACPKSSAWIFNAICRALFSCSVSSVKM